MADPSKSTTTHTGIARWIRRLAIPIILGWIGLVALLNTTVPQLEVVSQMRSVSMSPDEAPSMIAMKRVGVVFDEFHSDSSAMIVLEGDKPLGDDAHFFYNDMVAKLKADTKHV
jgi:putative drug exporter of the RND superfamily